MSLFIPTPSTSQSTVSYIYSVLVVLYRHVLFFFWKKYNSRKKLVFMYAIFPPVLYFLCLLCIRVGLGGWRRVCIDMGGGQIGVDALTVWPGWDLPRY